MTKFKSIGIKTNEELIANFETGDKPSGMEFAELIISKAHVVHSHSGDEIFIDGIPLVDIIEKLIIGVEPNLSLKSPNGTIFSIAVDDDGRLHTVPNLKKFRK